MWKWPVGEGAKRPSAVTKSLALQGLLHGAALLLGAVLSLPFVRRNPASLAGLFSACVLVTVLGLDLGTSRVAVVIAESDDPGTPVSIIGVGEGTGGSGVSGFGIAGALAREALGFCQSLGDRRGVGREHAVAAPAAP